MTDLISRQALCQYALNQKSKSVTPNDIMRFPSAVKHGKWIRLTIDGVEPQEYMCSVCGRIIRHTGLSALLTEYFPYCHCGARMDGE